MGAASAAAIPASAKEPSAFRYDAVVSLDDMRDLIRSELNRSSSRDEVRRRFVTEGHATLIVHRTAPDSEKYIYDINLCDLYVWRWNISADYAPSGRLREIYVNGEPVLDPAAVDPLMPTSADGAKTGAGVYKMARPRPEASKGENSLGYVLIDADADRRTTDDQMLVGAGPTRADPHDFGKLHAYNTVPWRSIFDDDIAPMTAFRGRCP